MINQTDPARPPHPPRPGGTSLNNLALKATQQGTPEINCSSVVCVLVCVRAAVPCVLLSCVLMRVVLCAAVPRCTLARQPLLCACCGVLCSAAVPCLLLSCVRAVVCAAVAVSCCSLSRAATALTSLTGSAAAAAGAAAAAAAGAPENITWVNEPIKWSWWFWHTTWRSAHNSTKAQQCCLDQHLPRQQEE